MISLDDVACLDPQLAGAKAAWLARGRRAGLPILPGVVVPAATSKTALNLGASVLSSRGSGAARLEVSAARIAPALLEELQAAAEPLGEALVVRSSSVLEGSGEWSGAFTSYLGVERHELGKAVAGCWASSFTVATLDRFEAAGIEPGRTPMAVLVQPALEPDSGGTGQIHGEGEVTVVGVKGSPAPLVQGWDPGVQARVSPGGVVRGAAAVDLLGEATLAELAEILRAAGESTGATACEWACVDGRVWLLQLRRAPAPPVAAAEVPGELALGAAVAVSRLVRRAPGPLGEKLVLPWALGDPELLAGAVEPLAADAAEALQEATGHSATLTLQVWGMPKAAAAAAAAGLLRSLRGSEPGAALQHLDTLRRPDPERARLTLELLATVRDALVRAGAVNRVELGWHIDPVLAAEILATGRAAKVRHRIGFDRWEPFDAAVIIANGRSATGTPAAAGMGAGRLCYIDDPGSMDHFRPRDVVVATHPVPNLAPLLWDAAAVVTTGGSPAAHLFESARALAIPAVCAVRLEEALHGDLSRADGNMSLAVDGHAGTVHAMPW